MKSISRNFGFWLLMALAVGLTLTHHTTGAVIALVGAIIFDAIKAGHEPKKGEQ